MAITTITEKFAYQGGRVRRGGSRPVVEGVLLCGATSANRRRYLRQAFEGKRVLRYSDVPVFIGHGDGKSERTYAEQIGWVRSPRHRSDGMPLGDIEVKPRHPLSSQFLWDAEHDARACSMSHVIEADTRRAADGIEEVIELVRAQSVDVIVAGMAATTSSLYESRRRQSSARLPLREYFARAGRRLGMTFAEAADDSEIGDVEMAGAADPTDATTAGAEMQIANAYAEAGAAIWKAHTEGKIDLAACVAKLKQYSSHIKTFRALVPAAESRRRPILLDDGPTRPPRITWDDDAPNLNEGPLAWRVTLDDPPTSAELAKQWKEARPKFNW